MAVFGQIPLQAGFTSMGELAELMLKKRTMEAEAPLHQAKAREANMMAELLARAGGFAVPQEEKPELSMIQKIMNIFKGHEEQPQASANQSMGQASPEGMNQPNNYNPENKLTPEGQRNASAAMQQNGSYILRPEDISADKMTRQQLVNEANQDSDFFQRNNQTNPTNPTAQNQPVAQPEGLPNTPEAIQAREVLQHLDKWKETPKEQQEREVATDWRKGINKNTIELVGDWGKKISASREMIPILEHNQEIMSTPVMKEVFSHPEYLGYDKKYLKKFSKDPTVIEGLNALGTNVKSLYSIMGSEFKGAFRFYEKQMFDEASPTESDSFGQLIAKNNTMMAIRDLITKRLSLAKQIVEGSNGQISPEAAESIAEKQINAKQVRQQIKDNFKKMQDDADKQAKALNQAHYSEEQLQKFYDDAIEHGVPKEAADKKLAELRGK